MKKWVKALPLTLLLLASPIKSKADNGIILPLVWSRDFVQAISYFKWEGKKENEYKFYYRSVAPVPGILQELLDKVYDTDWTISLGLDIRWNSNYEHYAFLVKDIRKDYENARDSYENLQENITDFIESGDDLESRLNDPEFTQNIGSVKDFVLNWESSLSLNVDYSKEENVEEVLKIINIAEEIEDVKGNFNELSEFITEKKEDMGGYDPEIQDLICEVHTNKENVANSLNKLTYSTNSIYSKFTNTGLDNPYSEFNYSINFAIVFPFGGK